MDWLFGCYFNRIGGDFWARVTASMVNWSIVFSQSGTWYISLTRTPYSLVYCNQNEANDWCVYHCHHINEIFKLAHRPHLPSWSGLIFPLGRGVNSLKNSWGFIHIPKSSLCWPSSSDEFSTTWLRMFSVPGVGGRGRAKGTRGRWTRTTPMVAAWALLKASGESFPYKQITDLPG